MYLRNGATVELPCAITSLKSDHFSKIPKNFPSPCGKRPLHMIWPHYGHQLGNKTLHNYSDQWVTAYIVHPDTASTAFGNCTGCTETSSKY